MARLSRRAEASALLEEPRLTTSPSAPASNATEDCVRHDPLFPNRPCGFACWLMAWMAASVSPAATPWPEFRGPTGDGVSQERNLPLEWSESRGIAWKTAIPGKAWSSPVIWHDLVWLTNATQDGRRLSAVAVAI
ncbi:MAG: hypothetical protein ACKOWG_02810, partial [Planctomycetia bacterium]